MADITPLRMGVDTTNWYDNIQPGVFATEMTLPVPDADYFYFACRLFSWFPVVNNRGATYLPDMITDGMIQQFVGCQANLQHDKGKVIGMVFAVARTDQGVDAVIRVDRDQALIQGLNLDQLREGNYFSHVSIENTRDVERSMFLMFDEGFNIVRTMPVNIGEDIGIRRTTARDPYLYQGCRVAEAIVPMNFTGVGLVPNPSDRTAEVYAMVADDETPERRKTLEPSTTDAASAVTDHGDNMTIETLQAELATVTAERDELKSKLGLKETASAELETQVTGLNSQIADLTSKLDNANKELASAQDEVKGFKLNAFVAELEAIKPCASDEDRTALREKASAALGDETATKILKLERENEALKEKASAAPAEVKPAVEVKPEVKPTETASTEKPAEDKPAVTPESKPTEVASGVEDDMVFKVANTGVPLVPGYFATQGGTMSESLSLC